MISVVMLTYKRRHLLEEAIESFLRQNQEDCELIIVNDEANVRYSYDDRRIKIFNFAEKYTSITSKLKLAFSLAAYDYMLRLDDDDLLAEDSLRYAKEVIKNNPGHDIYRSYEHYSFRNNIYKLNYPHINTGNIYTKKYISNIKWVEKSYAEDVWLTYENGAKIHTTNKIFLI